MTLRLGPVHLDVRDLDRSVSWYERALGLRVAAREAGKVELGDGTSTVIALHERPDARPSGRHAGLFHYCLLYPTREDLARAALRLEAADAQVTAMNDRHTHEAIYLPDPDGINIELAWDRPRDLWPETPYGLDPVELDVPDLLATVAGEKVAPSVAHGMSVGHVHFHVGDVEEAVAFYRDVVGFDLKYRVYYGVFFSVGGYHHQVAANVRYGEGIGPQPTNVVGLRHWTLQLPSARDVSTVRARLEDAGTDVEPIDGGFAVCDPWRLALHVVA